MNLARLRAAALVTVALAVPLRADGQAPNERVRAADSLLSVGRVSAAESLYYAAAAFDPRDHIARAALGNYLASRGAWRIGAVLLEEARFFGGNPLTIGRALAPIYRLLGDWSSIAALPAGAVTMGERAQAAWLSTHRPGVAIPDSAIVAFIPAANGPSFGTIQIRVAGRAYSADIDPSRRGMVVDADAHALAGVKAFRVDSTALIPASIAALDIGNARLTNAPAMLESLGTHRARIGLDVLAPFAPTFDPVRHQLILHRDSHVAPSGARYPMLLDGRGARTVDADSLAPLATSSLGKKIRAERWTYDVRRGEIVLPDSRRRD